MTLREWIVEMPAMAEYAELDAMIKVMECTKHLPNGIWDAWPIDIAKEHTLVCVTKLTENERWITACELNGSTR